MRYRQAAGARRDRRVRAASDPATRDDVASARVEWLVWLTFCLIRMAVLGQAAAALGLAWNQFGDGFLVAVLLAGLAVESALVAAAFRRGSPHRGTAVAAFDFGMTVAALTVTTLALKRTADPMTDNVLYPYSVTAMTAVGFLARRAVTVVVVPALACAAYAVTTVLRFAFHPGLVANSANYWFWSVLSFVLAGALRWLSGELDGERRKAVDLAQRQERAEAARSMHDHVLQTMEVATRDGWIPDERLRRQIATEVAWLRDWLDGKLDGRANDLVTALSRVTRDQAASGLRVELNAAGMDDPVVPPAVVEAVSGAVTEALANVRKHAGVTEAVVRAVRDADRIVVTVTDRGRGFDPDHARLGFGLRSCVLGRMREAGGGVSITSAPGAGTQIGLALSVRRRAADDRCPEDWGHAAGLQLRENRSHGNAAAEPARRDSRRPSHDQDGD